MDWAGDPAQHISPACLRKVVPSGSYDRCETIIKAWIIKTITRKGTLQPAQMAYQQYE